MQLNHLSLAVPQVAETSAFFEKHFGFTCKETKGNNIIAVLEGNDGFVLVLTTLRKEDTPYPADFHFGFLLDSKEAVEQLYHQLLADGAAMLRAPAKIRHSFGFYFHIPGGIMAEISCNLEG